MDNYDDITSKSCQKLTEYLETCNKRKTPERYEVLKAVVRTKGLFSVEMLSREMEDRSEFVVSRSTLFNTLELLTDAQLVIKHSVSRTAMYENNASQTPMACLVCQKCGKIEKWDDKDTNTLLASIHVRHFNVRQQILYLHGTCRKCANKSKNKKKN